ncbi:MAG: OmpA family protein [Pseudomonadota bacterium]
MRWTAAILAVMPSAALAMTLELPGLSTEMGKAQSQADTVFLPVSAFNEGHIQGVYAEGPVRKQSWRVGTGGMTTLQIFSPLRDQLSHEGYEILYECEAAACGGFDFRYELDTFPEPEMHIALADYRYLSAQKIVNGTPEYASLIVSRSANAGFVQLTQVGASSTPPNVTTSTKAPPPTTIAAGPVGEQLEASGHATLDDLTFKTGKAELGDESFATLTALAQYLRTRPDRQVVLVGHTDSEGSLEGNIALSKRRAGAVMARLVEAYGVPSEQVTADGIGYLAPIASNLTPEGRAQNRRVEVVLTSTE